MPADFVQHKEPKLLVDDLTPVEWPDDPAQEWCPPGHGDLYTALLTSGMLDALLDAGYRCAFISNSDNLGAVLEPRILAWIAREEIPFVMEVTDRTEADRKGGHIAKRAGGRLPAARDRADARRGPRRAAGHLAPPLREHEQPLGRPRGAQGADGRARRRARAAADRQQEDRRPGRQVHAEVFQLETAMGAAIGVFEGARPLRVPRSRFSPGSRPRTCSACARTPTC